MLTLILSLGRLGAQSRSSRICRPKGPLLCTASYPKASAARVVACYGSRRAGWKLI